MTYSDDLKLILLTEHCVCQMCETTRAVHLENCLNENAISGASTSVRKIVGGVDADRLISASVVCVDCFHDFIYCF